MKILVVGSGGREHALVWKLLQSKRVSKVFVAPGNAGTSAIAENIDVRTTDEIVSWLGENTIDLVVVGPDSYLAEGLTDILQSKNINVFGPTKEASEIEWSKAYAKQFMKEEEIPTARCYITDSFSDAKKYLQTQVFPVVIKASGLAGGKGVIIAQNKEEAEQALRDILEEKIFGTSGETVLIEEYMQGREISVHAFCDGKSAALFPSAKDHKRAHDGDKGPNTGGMGTISPVPFVSSDEMETIEKLIVLPTLRALSRRGRPFVGVLFPGIMLTSEGPKVIEFNARFGDPEVQCYMRLMQSDLLEVMEACVQGTLHNQNIEWSPNHACTVVLVSGGYPKEYATGFQIDGLAEVACMQEVEVFHAGTVYKETNIVTDGGRVLGVSAVGSSALEARTRAYEAAKRVTFKGRYMREDIGVA